MKKKVLVNHKLLVAFVLFLLAFTLFAYSVSALQQISSVVLNSTLGTNFTTQNLTAYVSPLNTSQRYIYDWKLDGSSIAILNMPFEGGSNSTFTKDYSDSSNNGTVNGSTFNSTGGYDGFGAYEFDGVNDKIHLNIAANENTTILVWGKSNSGDCSGIQTLLSSGLSTQNGISITGGSCTTVTFKGNESGVSITNAPGGFDITQWNHYAFVSSSLGVFGYLNGQLIASNTTSFNSITIDGAYEIGHARTHATRYWNGAIDEVQIINRSLSAEQISAIYNNRTDLIVSNETAVGEVWQVSATPTDGTDDGVSVLSNSLTVLETVPTIDSVILNATSINNLSSDNLTAYPQNVQNLGSGKIIYDWKLNGSSIAVLNMPFEGGSNATFTRDYSDSSNNGTVNGSTFNSTGGYDGFGAYEFDGTNDKIHLNINSNENTTISVWGRSNGGTCSGSGIQTLLSSGLSTQNGISVTSASCVSISFKGNDAGSGLLVSPAGFNITQWNYYAFVSNSSGLFAYLNGELIGSNTTSFTNINISGAYEIGHARTHATRYWNGTIDEVQIINRSLSAEQILALYNNRTDLIVSQETAVGEVWQVEATPNDGTQDGVSVLSNSLTILPSRIPEVTIFYPIDNAAYVTNITLINYTVTNGSSCWYSTDYGVTNSSSVSAGTAFTGINLGSSNLTVYCNSSTGDVSQDNISFIVGDFDITTEINKILASDNQSDDQFGWSVSISGDYAIVGAYLEDPGGVSGAGSAYIFKKNSTGQYEEVNKIQASDKEASDRFAWSVSISGDYAIVGSQLSGADNAGAAYIFKKNSTGQYEEVNKIQASDKEASDFFGASVSISGDYAIVGANSEDTGGSNAGAAYMFKKNSTGEFEEVNKIQASDKEASDQFGYSVSISGDYAIIGAYLEDAGGVSDAGSAYIFKKNSTGQYEEVNKIQASDKEASDQFGYSVSISGDYAISGANLEDTGGSAAGSAYIFNKNSTGQYEEVNKIQASDKEASDQFGWSVSISGDYAIIGAYLESTGASQAGSAYMFKKNSTGQYEEVNKIQASDKEASDQFGYSVSISGDYAISGANLEDTGGSNAGAAYIFQLSSSDSVNPSVFDLVPVANSNFNVSDVIEIGANVTDNVAVSAVLANVTLPNGTINQLSLSNTSDFYNVSFTIPNLAGTYNVRFIANDTSGNVNNTETTFFVGNNQPPNIDQVILNSSIATNSINENLTAYAINVTDPENDSVKVIYDWRVNGSSIAVLNMPFEGGSNSTFTKDYSDNGNNGNVNGPTYNSTGGYDGKGAYEFDGVDDKIVLNLVASNDVTLTVWGKSSNEENCSNSSIQTLLGSNFSVQNGIAVNGASCASISFKGNAAGAAGGAIVVSPAGFNITQWNYYAFASNSSGLFAYLNGELIGSNTTSFVNININGAYEIGHALNHTARYWNGTIDNVQIFNRSLSSEQILALYNNRTDLIVSQEIGVGENWSVSVTPNDGTQDGVTVQSNNLTVLADLIFPSVFDLIPVSNSTFNVSDVIEIGANVTDNAAVDTVLANVTLPNGTINQLTLSNVLGDKYNSSFTIPNLIGQYNITFIANDTSNNINASETTFFVGVDVIVPSVFDLIPVANSTFNVSDTIEITVNVTDNVEVDTVLANITFPNSTKQQLNLILINNTAKYNASFTIPALLGQYNVTFVANDTSNNINQSETTFFVGVDEVLPVITGLSCVPNPAAINSTITCNATVTDNVAVSTVFANVTLPNSSIVNTTLSINNSNYEFSFNTTSETGIYTVVWNATDVNSNTIGATTTFEIMQPMIIVLGCTPDPANLTQEVACLANITTGTPTPVDTVLANVTLPNQTVLVQTILNTSTIYNFTFTTTSLIGSYNVTWFANDTLGSFIITNDSFTVLDVTNPAVTALLPFANTTFEVNVNIEVGANVTDNIAVDTVLANITLPNGTINQLTLAATGDVYNTSFTIPALIGQYNITFIANDTSGNVNSTETTFFVGVDQIVPLVFDLIPVSNSSFNVSDIIEVSTNVTDNGVIDTVLANITFPNSTVQQLTLNNSLGNDKYNNSFTIPALLGQYNVTFIANDTSGNVNNTETTFFVSGDTAKPSVFALIPVSNTSFDVSDIIEIGANVTDNVAVDTVLANVTLPNGTIQQLTLSNVLGDKYNNSFTIPNLVGTYNITFIANDTTNNINASETTFFVGVETLIINSVQCSNDTVNYFACSSMAYGMNITHIRVNSTPSANISDVRYTLYNLQDNNNYINNVTFTTQDNDYFILNASFVLEDSGDWNLTITSFGLGTSVKDITSWNLPFGTLNATLIQPTANTSVKQFEFFTFQSNLTCIGGECGVVNVTLDPESESSNKTITINLSYKLGTIYDENDDGIETVNGVIDLTVENSLFNWQPDESKLCTRWEVYSYENETSQFACYGSSDCCAFADLLAKTDNWKEIYYSTYGKDGATLNNTIASKIIYYNVSLDSENLYAEIISSDLADLTAKYYFENVINATNQTISNETTQNQTQTLAGTTYAQGQVIKENNKQLGEKLTDEPDYETHFLSMNKTNTTLTVVFYHDYNETLPVRIEGNVTYNLSKETADYLENITLNVNLINGIIPRFKLHVGASSEIFEFGKIIPTINIEDGNYIIIDRDDTKLNVQINKNNESIEIKGIQDQSIITAKIGQANSTATFSTQATNLLQITTNIAFIESFNIEQATITLQKTGEVNAILQCNDDKFNYDTLSCEEWNETSISFSENENTITFTVDHFTAYAGGNVSDSETGFLTIWDENDPGMPNASQTRLVGQNVKFFADYLVSQNGSKITNANCSINFNNGTYNNMTYNESYSYYIYNRSFNNASVNSYNVKCSSSSYPNINATDTIPISSTTTKTGAVSTIVGAVPFYTTNNNPQICNVSIGGTSCVTTWNVNATGILDSTHTFFVNYNMTSNNAFVNDTQSSNIQITIVANDTQKPSILSTTISSSILINNSAVNLFMTASDNVQVDSCFANITLPDSTYALVNNTCTAQQAYTATQIGTFNVTFYANDTSGNIANTTGTFEVTISIEFNITLNVSTNKSAGAGEEAQLIVTFPATGEIIAKNTTNGSLTLQLPDANFDLVINTFNNTLNVTLRNVNVGSETGKSINLDRLVTPVSGSLVTYGVETDLNFTNATLVISYENLTFSNEANLKLEKCDNWNLAAQTCSGSFTDVTDDATTTQDTAGNSFSYFTTTFSGFNIKEVTPTPTPTPAPSAAAPAAAGGGGGGGACPPGTSLVDRKCVAPEKPTPEAEEVPEEPEEVEEIPEEIEEAEEPTEEIPPITGAVVAEQVVPLAANFILVFILFTVLFSLFINQRFIITVYRKHKHDEFIKPPFKPRIKEHGGIKSKAKHVSISKKVMVDKLKNIYK